MARKAVVRYVKPFMLVEEIMKKLDLEVFLEMEIEYSLCELVHFIHSTNNQLLYVGQLVSVFSASRPPVNIQNSQCWKLYRAVDPEDFAGLVPTFSEFYHG